jgi:hypothetical protein
MRRGNVAAGLFAIVALVIFGDVRPASAAIVYPWCAGGRISEVGAPSCGFSSHTQCMAASGGAGICTENPFYTGPTQSQLAPRPRLQ